MSKLGKDGQPIYNEMGKVMKGPNYFKPNLKNLLLDEKKLSLDIVGYSIRDSNLYSR